MTEQMQNPMQDEMQDGVLIVHDEGETETQLVALSSDMSLRPYNFVAANSYNLPALLENKIGDAEY